MCKGAFVARASSRLLDCLTLRIMNTNSATPNRSHPAEAVFKDRARTMVGASLPDGFADPSLPDGWTQLVDSKNRTYYSNHHTRENNLEGE